MRTSARLLLLSLALGLTAAAIGADDELPLEGKTQDLSFTTTTGSWMSLDVTPDGETLIFDLLGDLYSLPLEGGKATRITTGLGFDSQPAVSPDGEWLAFVSDRNGADNLWISRIDGSDARKLSDEKQFGIISPAWSPDGQFIVVTKTADKPELTQYHVAGGSGISLSGPDDETEVWGVGAQFSPSGRFLYFAAEADSNGPVEDFPKAQIMRYDRRSGDADQITRGEGGGLRPVLSPDGTRLVYGTRRDAQTGLRLRDLESGSDRWLTYPVQRDAQENFRPPSRDVLPGYAFTPEGRSIIFNAEGSFHRVDVESGERAPIAFSADIELQVGPDLSAPYAVPQGPVTATLIHDPQPSPDGTRIVSSVLASLYVSERDGGNTRRLTDAEVGEFKPVWSPDGRWIAYVSWDYEEGGHIWRMRADGRGSPQRLTEAAAFYTDPAYAPDGNTLYALRGNGFMRQQTFSEFTGLGIPLELVSLPAEGGEQTRIRAAREARNPHFGADPTRIYLYDEDGLYSIATDGTDKRHELTVTGPKGNRRSEKPLPAEAVRISPTGTHALAFVNKQLWVLPMTVSGSQVPSVDVRKPSLPTVRLTDIGADFFGWSNDGVSVHWAVGNTWYERPLTSVDFHQAGDDDDDEDDSGNDDPFVPADENAAVQSLTVEVTVARSTPHGTLLLRGANVIPMRADSTEGMSEVLTDHDILIVDNRIEGLGPSGSFDVDDDVEQIDVAGRYVIPGLIDTHAHWEFRTGDVLEPHNWSLAANLAYGVTTGLDVQTAHKDYLAYRDFQATGRSVGQRAFMVAEGIFGTHDFQSYDETLAYLRRYAEHYHTRNIKSYLVGNRRQRQWIVLAAKELGLMPTTEGGADQKLDLTHAIDGMHGNEHNLPDIPIFDDVVELFARTKTAYTPTLIVQYNSERMREYFFTRSDVLGNEKLRRFYPANRLRELTERRPGWRRDAEFLFAEGAAQAAKIQRAGGLVGVGGHAELQGLGYHWEMWAYGMGGMTPTEILRAATIDGARIIGIEQDLGSIEPGKLADLVVLTANPLDDIRKTTAIQSVMQNGRLYDGDTLDQRWPDQTALPPFWWWRDENRGQEPTESTDNSDSGNPAR